MLDALFYALSASAALTLITLCVGILSFARGGAFHSRHANRLMRYRIASQALTIALFVAYAALRSAS